MTASDDHQTRLEHLVATQASRTPEQPALSDGSVELSYRELERDANELAARLTHAGVAPGDRIGIAMTRSYRLPLTVLAVLKAQASYVPLDLGYPADRLAFMAEEAGVTAIITERGDRPGWVPEGVTVLAAQPSGVQPTLTPAPAAESASDTAYVIFTSGSTGRPKGVVMPHGPLVNLVRWQATQPGLGRPARTLQYTPLSFDVSCQELFTTWAVGGCLVMVDDDTRRDPYALVEYLAAHRVQRLFLPFAALDGLCQALCRLRIRGMRLTDVVTAGEQLRITAAIRAAFSEHLVARLHNHYGPSETHVVTAHVLTGDAQAWPELPPIGAAIDNARLFVRGADAEVAPTGVTGELYVAGPVLATGYANQPQLSAERFVDVAGMGRAYRTGDLARCDDDGTWEFLGRDDDQVKIRGFRVELGEVESALGALPGVAQAAVVIKRGSDGLTELVGHVVAEPGTGIVASVARTSLGRLLPEYMVPSRIVVATALPLTPSGKIDRRQLAAADFSPLDTGTASADGDTLDIVLDIHREVLATEVTPEDNFFALGGNSLHAVQIITRLMDVLAVRVSARTILSEPTIGALAERVNLLRRQDIRISPAPAAEARPVRGRASMAQEWAMLSRRSDAAAPALQFHAAYRVSGPIDANLLRGAVQAVIDRHPMLRASLAVEGDTVAQIVAPQASADLRYTDLRADDLDESLQRALDLLQSEADRPFDASSAPMMRVVLAQYADKEHLLGLVLDHLVADGWSLDVIARDLSTAYRALACGQTPQLTPTTSYVRWSQQQRARVEAGRLDEVADYWLGQLGPDPAAFAVRLPGYRPNTGLFGASAITVEVPAHLAGTLRETARRLRTTEYSIAMAALKVLIAHRTGATRVTVLTSAANRLDEGYPETVGWFANGVFPTSDIDLRQRFAVTVDAVHATVQAAVAHGDLPAWYVRRRMWPEVPAGFRKDPGVYFMYSELWGSGLQLDGAEISPVYLQEHADAPGLQMWLTRHGDTLRLQLLHYDSEYAAGDVTRFGRDYLRALAALIGRSGEPAADTLREAGL